MPPGTRGNHPRSYTGMYSQGANAPILYRIRVDPCGLSQASHELEFSTKYVKETSSQAKSQALALESHP